MIIRAEGIRKNFIRKQGDTNLFSAVQKTDFNLNPGELVVISGRSGSGKSTLMNMLAGLLAPTEGRVLATYDDGDKDIYGLKDEELSNIRNKYFGYIPQVQSPIASLSVIENVILPTRLYSVKAASKSVQDDPREDSDILRSADELLQKLDIANLADVMPSELSGGELRRTAIARALINNPQVIFADEPTGDLDDDNTRAVLSLLREKADEGASVLLVTHENDAFEYGDRVLKMSGGILEG